MIEWHSELIELLLGNAFRVSRQYLILDLIDITTNRSHQLFPSNSESLKMKITQNISKYKNKNRNSTTLGPWIAKWGKQQLETTWLDHVTKESELAKVESNITNFCQYFLINLIIALIWIPIEVFPVLAKVWVRFKHLTKQKAVLGSLSLGQNIFSRFSSPN